MSLAAEKTRARRPGPLAASCFLAACLVAGGIAVPAAGDTGAGAAGGEETVLVTGISVSGNRVTSERYIRSLLALEAGRRYDFDQVIDLISLSRQRLEKTGLFTNIFFDDRLVEENGELHVELTVRVREKGYLRFGPSGHAGLQGGDLYADLSVYGEHVNLWGNGSRARVELALYQDLGVLLLTENRLGRGTTTLSLGYEYLDEDAPGTTSHLALAGVHASLSPLLGVGISGNLYAADAASLVLVPSLTVGSRARPDKEKSWFYGELAPVYGFNQNREDFYGAWGEFALYRDLFLQLVYELDVRAGYLDGSPPERYRFTPHVRGTDPERVREDVLFSVTNELRFPWPTSPRVHLVPFFDFSVIGRDPEVMMGGGLGVHWYTRFQDPLVLELAFGKGVMVNFSRYF